MAVWLVLVAAADGLTLWWQNPEQPQRHGGQEPRPTPALPEGWQLACAHATPDENGRALCFIRTR
ncbi:hypothetical protein ACLVWQ_28350 [Streptomyces sp. CWNU-52B]|uniref:hypothetical protein n=1 Tax=unclassified Streptomyces TaxID=2593676 RepID=UPI0039C311B3